MSELGPQGIILVLTIGAVFLAGLGGCVGAVLGALFSKVRNRMPGSSTLLKAVLFYFVAWLIFQFLIQGTRVLWLALVNLVLSLLWGASFGYLFNRHLHGPTKSRPVMYPSPAVVAVVTAFSAVLLVVGGLVASPIPSFPGFDPSIWVAEWLIIVPPLLLLKRRRMNARNALSLGKLRLRHVLLGLAAGIVSYPILGEAAAVMEDLLGPYPQRLLDEAFQWFPTSWLGMIPWLGGIAVSTGVAEEILFRGFVQNGLRRNWGPAKALIVSSVIFAVLHLDPWRILLTEAFGLIAGYLFLRTNSLYTSMAMHMVTNSISSILTFANYPPPNFEGISWFALLALSGVSTVLILFASNSRIIGREPEAFTSASTQRNYCAKCGTPIVPGSRFCTECGWELV
jgi:membrane protease YdiL (CAAX protease family)